MMNKPLPDLSLLRPRITVIGVGGAGSNAVNNMIDAHLSGVDFIAANTDAQALTQSRADYKLQLGTKLTQGLGAGAKPEIGAAAAEEAIEEIREVVDGSHIVFVAAGMGGGTGTGAASVIAKVSKDLGILTVGVVTKPFHFEGSRRMRIAETGVTELRKNVDTLIVIPNQNLFRIASERTTFAEAFVLADQVLYSGVACIVDMIVKDGLINLDFADVRAVMNGMGSAMMGTGEGVGENRARLAAENAITNPLLDDMSLSGAKGLLLSITGGPDLTLYEVDEVATRVRQEVDPEANIIVGATFDDSLGDRIRVSLVASGLEKKTEFNESSHPSAKYVPSTFSSQLQDGGMERSGAQGIVNAAEGSAQSARGEGQATESSQRSLMGAIQTVNSSYSENTFADPVDVPPPLPYDGAVSGPQKIEIQDLSSAALINAAQGAGQHSDSILRSHPAQEGSEKSYETGASGSANWSRRIPDVSEFPVVGQREYYAKSHKALPDPLGYSADFAATQMAPQSFWKNFVDRITGRKRNPSDSFPERVQPQNMYLPDSPQLISQRPGHPIHLSSPQTREEEDFDRDIQPKIPMFFRKY